MRLFVTGADGFIGSAISAQLREKGHRVMGLVRSDRSEASLKARGDRAVRGELSQFDLLAQTVKEVDGVIHVALTANAEGIELDKQVIIVMLDQLVGSGKPFIYTSGTLVTGDSGERVTDETEPVQPDSPRGWRGLHEQLVLQSAARGVRAIVIRPSTLVYGPGAKEVLQIVQQARQQGAVSYVGNGQNRRSTVHVDDFAALYVLALEKAQPGELFIGAGDEVIRQKELAEAASRAGGAGGKTVSIPYEEAVGAMGLLATIQTMNSVVSSAKARRELGWQPTGPALLDELARGVYSEM